MSKEEQLDNLLKQEEEWTPAYFYFFFKNL